MTRVKPGLCKRLVSTSAGAESGGSRNPGGGRPDSKLNGCSVRLSDKESKSGLSDFSEIKDLAYYCKEFPNINLIGLMTIAPLTNDINLIRKSFGQLRKLKERLNIENLDIKELSMGMTSDFEVAIEEGATMLRIGSAIFGERNYSKDWKEII